MCISCLVVIFRPRSSLWADSKSLLPITLINNMHNLMNVFCCITICKDCIVTTLVCVRYVYWVWKWYGCNFLFILLVRCWHYIVAAVWIIFKVNVTAPIQMPISLSPFPISSLFLCRKTFGSGTTWGYSWHSGNSGSLWINYWSRGHHLHGVQAWTETPLRYWEWFVSKTTLNEFF